MMLRTLIGAGLLCFSATLCCAQDGAAGKIFRAGAVAIDVTPLDLPVIVNGGMTERVIEKIEDRLHARCLVLDDGTAQIAIVIVDSCMMPRDLLDHAKEMASKATGIPTAHMLIAATHTHSAPSVFGCLGSDVDPKYATFLPGQIAKGIQQAHANLQPARIGWAVGRNDTNVASRRWLMKPGIAPTNPHSGKANDRVMMHPGPANKNAVAATGIIDPDVPVLAVQTLDGRPLAVLTNYSMHYVGAPNISADYFAVVCDKLTEHLRPAEDKIPFVALHSNGTSGDQWLMDYTQPRRMYDRFSVGADLAASAYEAYQRIFYYDWVPLVMAEQKLEVGVRQPSAEELAAAKELCETFADRKPKTVPEVYAREAVLLAELPPTRELKLQALRIGELGIAAIPNEVFSSTGLMLKIESPLPTTFTIELANGCFGYIPPPKQHKLGGYETWRARSSCLEVNAEPKIRAAVLELLNKVNEERAEETLVLTPDPRPPSDEAQDKTSAAAPSESKPAAVASPLSPEEALKHFQLTPGLKIELVAAEPLIVDPVALAWSDDGKLWVVEMRDYPNGMGAVKPDDVGPPGGRVKVLEDRNGDGRYDTSTVFASDLPFPNSVLVLPDGNVLVTAAPQILRLKDTNGDGQADEREVLFSGFAEANQQLRVNGLKWGLDGWIYCANGGVGRGDPNARIKIERTGELVDLGARDFRFSLDFKKLEPQLGMSQFGRNCDDFGNWFGCNNNTPLYHVVHDDAMLRRNPLLAPEATTAFVPEIPKPGPVFAISEKGIFYHPSEVGRFTSANSAMIYRDRLPGDDFYGNFFVSEPVHNLVHREIVARRGATFTAQRPTGDEAREFLASRDTWFRPNMIRTGPDGALYISDMYREMVEHPHWIAADKKQGLIFRKGEDRGRIWRIVPADGAPRAVSWRRGPLDAAALTKLAEGLDDPSGELRDLRQQRLINQREQLTEAALAALAKLAGGATRAEVRVQALWTLNLLEALGDEQLIAHLSDEHPGVRAQAVRIAGQRLATHPALAEPLLKLTRDEDAAVQLQLAYLLGNWPDERAAHVLGEVLYLHGGNVFVREAALSSVNKENIAAVFAAVPTRNFERRLELAKLGARLEQWKLAGAILNEVCGPERSIAACEQLGLLLETFAAAGVAYSQLLERLGDKELAARLAWHLDGARELADSGQMRRREGENVFLRDDADQRAFVLLGRGDRQAEDIARLVKLLAPQQTPARQAAAAAQLIKLAPANGSELLLTGWKAHSPALRAQILDGLLARANWTEALLAKLDSGEVAPADLDAVRRARLLAHPNAKVKERAANLLATSGNQDRQAVLAQWSKVLTLEGDTARGKLEFTKRCATCHKWQGEGKNVGPDLNTLTDRSAKTLLTAVLDPNAAVEPKYQSYLVTTEDGKVLSGLLLEETANSLVLVDAGGKQITIARSNIETLQATGKSLMPEGLERDITPQALADILKLLAK